MNDDELYELMRREADQAPLGDGADLHRGRARLRRRRLRAGTTGVAGVALAAVLVGGYVSTNGVDDGMAPDPSGSGQDRRSDLEKYRDNMASAKRSVNVIAEVVEEQTRFEEFGQDVSSRDDFGADEEQRIDSTRWENDWHEAGGVGLLQVHVDRYDSPPVGWDESCSRDLVGRSGWPWPRTYDSCDPRTVNGQTVLVGVERRADRLWIVVRYLRVDDTLVELGFSTPAPESGADPVLRPSLSVEEMAGVATDPRVRIYDVSVDDHDD